MAIQPRAVKCVETGDVYQSSGAAGRAFNIDPSGILKCCKGQANHAAGHTWVFADEDDSDEVPVNNGPAVDQTADDQYDDDDQYENDDSYDDDNDDDYEDDSTVADFMKTDIITIKASDSLAVAEHIMLEGNFLRLPVVDENNQLIGIITQYDVKKKQAEITEFTQSKFLDPGLPVEKFVNRDIVMTTPDEPVSEIERAYDEFNAKFLPVVASADDRTLVGVVTYFDYINNR
jgi:CBS domain-containing protein